jgi:hypothetical protein
MSSAHRQPGADQLLEADDAVALERADGDDLGLALGPAVPRLHERQEVGLGDPIDLVEGDHDRGPLAGLDDGRGVGVGQAIGSAGAPLGGVDHEEDDVAVGGGGHRLVAHEAAQGAGAEVEAGGVDEGDLGPAGRDLAGGRQIGGVDAEDAVAGGLRLRGHGGEPLAQDAVEQGRLAGIGQTQERAEAGPGGGAVARHGGRV